MTSRTTRIALAVVVVIAVVFGAWLVLRLPPDTTPKGAYMRIARSVGSNRPDECFAYLEEEAQHAAFSIAGTAQRAAARIREAYPEPQKSEALAPYAALADAGDGPQIWAKLAAERGWIARLRRDLSGVVAVEEDGERATITTAHGTRYTFRRRPNGIWGLTLFSAELIAESERIARDWERIQRDAADYERAATEKAAP